MVIIGDGVGLSDLKLGGQNRAAYIKALADYWLLQTLLLLAELTAALVRVSVDLERSEFA